MTKVLQNADTEGNYLIIIKATYDKPTTNIILNGEKLKVFPHGSETRQEYLLLALLFSIILKVRVTAEKKNYKKNPNWKRSKTVIADNMILHKEIIKIPPESY